MSSRRFVLHGVLVAVLVAGNLWLGLNHSTLSLPVVLSEIAAATCFAVTGLAAWWLRPRSRTGPWLLALGIVVLVNNPLEFRLPSELPGHGLAVLVGGIATWLQYAVAGHVVLAYPSGRLTRRPERLVVTAAFVLAVVGGSLLLLTNRDLHVRVQAVVHVGWMVLSGVATALLIRRILRTTIHRRRVLTLALAMFALSSLFFLGLTVAVITGGLTSPVTQFFRYGHQWMAAVALPGAFFVGLLREQLAFASVGTLVGKLERVPASEVEAALGEILRDRRLRVAFPTSTGYVDVSGRPYMPPEDGSQLVTPLGDPPTVVLVHDPVLSDDLELLDAAANAARLALDNARLHAEARVQLAEVLASRQRIAAAADNERQRLERDLHDGAQQRFLGLGLALGVLRGRLADTPERDMVDELERELRAAIRELREVAQGIRPAVLTDQGLTPALAGLARRAAVRVALDLQVANRLDPIIEATAYYVVSEALQNTVKHADASDARIMAVRKENSLVVEVTDNGCGGADALSGTGLGGLADRVSAVGGTFEIQSPPGGGTKVRAELPCG